jgi:hypothetical protein
MKDRGTDRRHSKRRRADQRMSLCEKAWHTVVLFCILGLGWVASQYQTEAFKSILSLYLGVASGSLYIIAVDIIRRK